MHVDQEPTWADEILQCFPSSLVSRRASCGRLCSRWRREGGLASECGRTTSACALQAKAYRALRGSPSYFATDPREHGRKSRNERRRREQRVAARRGSRLGIWDPPSFPRANANNAACSLTVYVENVQCSKGTTCFLPSRGCSTPRSSH